ncbi:hypothetical protein LXL04_035133 [Taraxacum kok-saghyz]
MTKQTNFRFFTAILFFVILLSQYSFAVGRPLTTGNVAAPSMPEKAQFDAGKWLQDHFSIQLVNALVYISNLRRNTRISKANGCGHGVGTPTSMPHHLHIINNTTPKCGGCEQEEKKKKKKRRKREKEEKKKGETRRFCPLRNRRGTTPKKKRGTRARCSGGRTPLLDAVSAALWRTATHTG